MYSFQDLIDIIARLRGEGGCPWDAEQTHQSLKKNMIDEAYEATEAIDSGSGPKMADELGDLLLQIVFHAQIGKEENEFTIDDVTTAVCEKMIRRHPHVFADTEVSDSDEVIVNWDNIKKEEKQCGRQFAVVFLPVGGSSAVRFARQHKGNGYKYNVSAGCL